MIGRGPNGSPTAAAVFIFFGDLVMRWLGILDFFGFVWAGVRYKPRAGSMRRRCNIQGLDDHIVVARRMAQTLRTKSAPNSKGP